METSRRSGEAGRGGEARLGDFFARGGADARGLAVYLDGLDEAARLAATRAMTPRQQASLFEAAKGLRALALDHFVPASAPPLAQVRHAGKNSIAVFSLFEKRFCRPEAGADRLWGYNENPRLIKPVTGPGYFVCYAIDAGEALIDYLQVPPSRPEGWPPVRPNSAGASRFIYGGTQDTMRGVSAHVSVGRAARGGKWMDNWFVLCRRSGG